jgi:hypothetical protein
MWLRERDEAELQRLGIYLERVQASMSPRGLRLDDRLVVLVRATVAQLGGAVDVLDDLVELRKPAEHLGFLTDGWEGADPYVLHYLISHAEQAVGADADAAVSPLADLLDDAQFVARAEATRLLGP